MVEKKTGSGASCETINNINSSTNGSSSSYLNSTAYHNSSASIFNLSSASTTSVTVSGGSTSTSNSFWSRTLKFTSANGILVTLSSTADELPSRSSIFLSGGQEVSSPSTSEPNSLTLYDESQDLGGDLAITSSSRNPFNSASRRANSRSPASRKTGSSVLSPVSSSSSTAGGIKEAVLLLFKEKSGRYVLCRVC